MLQSGIIFDGDDTLWETMKLYTAAKQEFYDLLAKVGWPRIEVEPLFEKIDKEAVAEFGFSRKRFPGSMASTYKLLCQSHGVAVDAQILTQSAAIGESVFDKPVHAIEGARETLDDLHRDFDLSLATKGDQLVQKARLEQSRLGQYFDAVYYLEHKLVSDIRHIISDRNLDKKCSWVVGNSLRSDIHPAIRANLRHLDSK